VGADKLHLSLTSGLPEWVMFDPSLGVAHTRAKMAKPLHQPFRVVLAEPRHPGNVGSSARACANFEVADLVLVNPRESWPSEEARKFAVGPAREILESARVMKSVPEALADCAVAVGFTRRSGSLRTPSIELADVAALSSRGRVALVFGNEETGLTREELKPCTHLCAFSTGALMPSMNLSHAVALALGRIHEGLAEKPRQKKAEASAATVPELESMFTHWREFLLDVGLKTAGNPERILRRLRRIFQRSSLDRQEIRVLRGILSKAQVALGVRARGKRVARTKS
jgi:TrmH family RNA methyltransferase